MKDIVAIHQHEFVISQSHDDFHASSSRYRDSL